MKNLLKFSVVLLAVAGFITACQKADQLPFYGTGSEPSLSSDVSAIAPSATDSNSVVLNLDWTYPNFASDSATAKYIVQIDAAGNNFANASTKQVIGALGTSFTGKEFNDILLGFGYAFNVAYDLEIRVIASYANNNDQQISNILSVTGTAYKIPPKVELPSSGKLYIVGSATAGGWNNPVPVPAQEFAQVGETKWSGVFYLTGGQEFLILPVNGIWDNKYAVADNTVPGLNEGGDFGYNLSNNFPGPTVDGWYKMEFDFQAGKFAVSPYLGSVPADLFIVGSATIGGWNNPVPVPSQQLIKLNSSNFELELDMNGGSEYLLLPENGSWGKYGLDNGTPESGIFKSEGGNFIGPSNTGKYKLEVSFLDNTYKVEEVE